MCGWVKGDGGPGDDYVCDPAWVTALCARVDRLVTVAWAAEVWRCVVTEMDDISSVTEPERWNAARLRREQAEERLFLAGAVLHPGDLGEE